MLIWLGLFGLVASFHGIILGYSRQIYALGREGYLPWLAKLHPLQDAGRPSWLAAWSASSPSSATSTCSSPARRSPQNIVTMSVFGAIVMYIISILSLFKLRKTEPGWPAVPRAVVSLFPRVFPGGGHRLSGDDDLL